LKEREREREREESPNGISQEPHDQRRLWWMGDAEFLTYSDQGKEEESVRV
jgi:hypothetical protein